MNRASYEFLDLRADASTGRSEGEGQGGRRWQRVLTDSAGFLQLGSAYGMQARNAVFWASTHIWIAPGGAGTSTDVARIITDSVPMDGDFRAARMSGSSLKAQSNKYRVWVNGIRIVDQGGPLSGEALPGRLLRDFVA